MCNLYSITTNQEAIIRLFRKVNRYVGNLAPMLGVFPDYRVVRNLVIVTGRFFDEQDEQQHNKVGVITQKMADELFGSPT